MNRGEKKQFKPNKSFADKFCTFLGVCNLRFELFRDYDASNGLILKGKTSVGTVRFKKCRNYAPSW
jgi:hypothetical protein